MKPYHCPHGPEMPLLASIAILAICGCGGPRPSVADSERAQQALQTALDAWREGGNPDELRQRSPPIHFGDAACEQGQRLIGYQLPAAPERFGHSLRFRVELTVDDSAGTDEVETASYLVDTNPMTVIIRE